VFVSLENLPPVILRDRAGCACQIQGVVVVASSIADVIHGISFAGIDMVCRKTEATGSKLLWSLDERSAKASFDMELDVAVEEPDTYICQYLLQVVSSCGTNLGYLL
jgi:hypothetical protein